MAETTAAVRSVLEAFLHDLHGRLDRKGGTGTHELEVVLSDDAYSLESVELGSRPETYTEDHLIHPLLDAVGLAYERQPYGERGGTVVWPDFEVTNLDTKVIGESKRLNNFESGVEEIQDYLDRKSIGAEYGVVTDGIEWSVYKIELGGDFTEYPEISRANIDLRGTLLAVAAEEGLIEQANAADADEQIERFASVFEHESFERLLSQTAPREIRDRRKRDVETFYELYIELLFGESDEHDYETCLMDDIRFVGAGEPTERDKRLFAITLVNRLLFVKFLETRGVLSEGFLRERVEHYERHRDELAGNLYETQIRPLFYELLNTPEGERDPKHRDPETWFADVPYLNGGLFRENVEEESRYRVIDRILPDVVRDLIEGSKLELDGRGFDPALLGSVFEKTINHIEQERTQKDIGAYYTPNDVTEIVTEQSVDPKIRDVIVETFAEAAGDGEQDGTGDGEQDGAGDGEQDGTGDGEQVAAYMEQLELSELLRKIEDGDEAVLSPGADQTRIDFGDEAVLSAVKENLRTLKVLDPACGSGHFLTTAMDEVHRAQVSVLRGLNGGEEPDPETRFAEKKALALDAVYGVDVDQIASEIAKLRVWLKIVEGNGWEPAFGKLPNIDVNITHGNSLVGLPTHGTVESADIWDERVEEMRKRRLRYKREDVGDPREIERAMNDIRERLDRNFLATFNTALETELTDPATFERVVESFEETGEKTLYPTFESVQITRADGEGLTDEDIDLLESKGFTTYTKSARLDIKAREHELKNRQVDGVKDEVLADLRELIEERFVFAEFVRRPLACDLDRVTGRPFHWVAEFPEVAEENGSTHSINFDIVLGNPPYGDLLSAEEKLFVSNYETSGIRDISANFVERQLQLLEEGGYFGNVTTLRLVYQSSLSELYDLMRDTLGKTKIACFGSRPSRIFENADINVAVIAGDKNEESNEILTSDLIIFTEENRKDKLKEIEYTRTEEFVLKKKIGSDEGSREILPKIGSKTKASILKKLRDHPGPLFREQYSRESEGDHEYPIWRREGLRYWVNPMREELYSAREVKPIYFESKVERDIAFLVLNSSLFYTYWLTYGNFHHLNWSQIEAFPFPTEDDINEHSEIIQTLADEVWTQMKQQFDPDLGVSGEFHMRPVKPLINQVDELLAELYSLSDEELEFVQTYLTDCGDDYGRVAAADEEAKTLTDFTPPST